MAVKGQPIHGQHVRFELLLDGIPQDCAPQITELTKRARYDKVETKILGETSPLIDHVPTGWEGTATLAVRSKSLEQMINAYNFAKRNNLPVLLNIVEQVTYRDASSQTFVYPEIEVEFDLTAKRGSVVEIKIPWVTGKDRITL
ncbi:MAG TPA: hypothetical protein VEB22_15470 [Phycisphaerales bacterium]|nr:hypothetical protein [Phycisphaerales bacterium]